MAQPRTCATAWAVPVASELPLPTYHTSQALGFWYVGIVGGMGGRGACCPWATGFDLDGKGFLRLLGAIHGRVRVWRSGHRDRATDRPVGLRGQDGCAAASGRFRSRSAADAVGGWVLFNPAWMASGGERRGCQVALRCTVGVWYIETPSGGEAASVCMTERGLLMGRGSADVEGRASWSRSVMI